MREPRDAAVAGMALAFPAGVLATLAAVAVAGLLLRGEPAPEPAGCTPPMVGQWPGWRGGVHWRGLPGLVTGEVRP